MARKRYCPVCGQTFVDNNAPDEEITASCKDKGYKSEGEDGDCSQNFWVKLSRKLKGKE